MHRQVPGIGPVFSKLVDRVVNNRWSACRVPDGSCGQLDVCVVEPDDPSWLKLVRTPAGVVDRFEGLAQVVGERVRGGDDVVAGLGLDGAVAAGGLDEFAG